MAYHCWRGSYNFLYNVLDLPGEKDDDDDEWGATFKIAGRIYIGINVSLCRVCIYVHNFASVYLAEKNPGLFFII